MILFPLNLAGFDDQQTPDGHQGHRGKQFSQYSHFSSSETPVSRDENTVSSAGTRARAHGNVQSTEETLAFRLASYEVNILPIRPFRSHYKILWTMCTCFYLLRFKVTSLRSLSRVGKEF